MKRTLMVLALLAVTSVRVHAGEYEGGDGGDGGNQGSSNSQASASAAVTGGGSSASINNHRPAVSSAISPSVSTDNDCQIATPSSKAFSVLVFSASGTTGVTYNDICFAYKMHQFDIAEKLMCLKSQDYAKANPNCAK